MNLVRYETSAGTFYGELDGDVIHRLIGDFFTGRTRTGNADPMAAARLLHPTLPTKIVNMAVNPADSTDAHYEGEVAVVIGRRASQISAAEVRAHVLGICCANDISERAWQGGDSKDTQWWRAKSADTFSPFGPHIATDLDYDHLGLETHLNGETVQKSNTEQLVFSIDECIAYISQYMTLEPGDLVFTGTPGTTGPLSHGDIVEIEVAGVGILRNPVEHR